MDKIAKSKKAKSKKNTKTKSKSITNATNEIKSVDDLIDQLLRQAYPIISQGLGWTRPQQSATSGDLTFMVRRSLETQMFIKN